MQFRLPFENPRDSRDLRPPATDHRRAEGRRSDEAPPYRIHFVRMRQARRYVMRVRPDGDLRVTIPRGGSKAEALEFADRHRGWAERQRATLLAVKRPPAIDRELRVRAAAQLPPRVHALAAQHGLTVARVTIRDQRSRWGSCSPRGHIALNFRLMLMPPDVREYILIHELMHLRQANHSRKFWRLVEAACPGFREAERWLRANGPALF